MALASGKAANRRFGTALGTLAVAVTANLAIVLPAAPAAAAPGGRIAFASNRDGNYDIYVMNPDGTAQTQLTNDTRSSGLSGGPVSNWQPGWSSDGRKIAWSRFDGQGDIWVMNSDGSGKTQLTSDAADEGEPDWSPDGSKIVYYKGGLSAQEIWVMNADGTGQTQLTASAGTDIDPDWSPDGSRIAFTSIRSGDTEIWSINADGTTPRRLTASGGADQLPSWSADGTQIAFTSDRNGAGNDEIYVMNLIDGFSSGQVRLTQSAGSDAYPAWHPGTRITFSSARGGSDDIWIMKSDGTGLTQLNSDAGSDIQPDRQTAVVADQTPTPTVSASTPTSPADDNAPRISGTAEAGSTVRLYTNATCTSAVAATGTAEAFSSPGLSVAVGNDSTTTFYATATSATAVTSNCSTTSVTYVEDSTAPAAPTASGSSPAGPANDNAPRISGSAEAGSTVRLYTDATCTSAVAATGTAAEFASPGLTVTVADDSTTTFFATATDVAGHPSACSTTAVTYVEDSTAPGVPELSGTSPASPANDNAPAVHGTAEPVSTVRLYTDSACTSAVAATGSAADFAGPGLNVTVADDSTTTFFATATDLAGNPSACSTTSVTYVEDSSVPAMPTVSAVSPTSPADDNAPVVSGTAEAGSTVRLYTDSACSLDVVATGTAADFATPGLTVAVADDSTTSFYAVATDDAGQPSDCSATSVTYVEDSTAPGAPDVSGVAPASPADDNSPSVSGSAEAGSTVRLYTDSACSSAAAATGTAAAFASPGLAVTVADDSTTRFFATATDPAGNPSACSATSVSYVEDSTVPAAPTLTGTTPASPADDNTPMVSGTAEDDATVRLYTDAACSSAAAATGSAADFASPGLRVTVADDSTTTFYAAATDRAGHVSDCSSTSVTYVEDSTPPDAPSITDAPPASGSDTTPTWSFTAEPGAVVECRLSDAAGVLADWASCASPYTADLSGQPDGDYTLSVRATDQAGHTGPAVGSSYTLVSAPDAPPPPVEPPDTTAPAAPVITEGPPPSGADRSLSWSFTTEAGATAECRLSRGDTVIDDFAPCASPWAVDLGSLPDGDYTFSVRAVDAAGNVGSAARETYTLMTPVAVTPAPQPAPEPTAPAPAPAPVSVPPTLRTAAAPAPAPQPARRAVRRAAPRMVPPAAVSPPRPGRRTPVIRPARPPAPPPAVFRSPMAAPLGRANASDIWVQSLAAVLERSRFPLFLLLLVVAFIIVQNRIDRRDPKLASAPLRSASLGFS